MSWYRGQWTHGRNSLAWLYEQSKKDFSFNIINEEQAETTVLLFVYSPLVKWDTRFYSGSAYLYKTYKKWCNGKRLKPISSWQFKQNIELLGFPYLKHHRFYAGYHKNKVTTAFKNIGVMKR